MLAYEWSSGAALAIPTERTLEPAAPHAELEGLIGQIERRLLDKGYFHPPERAKATRNTLRTIFTKPAWSSREVKAVRGVVRALMSPKRPR